MVMRLKGTVAQDFCVSFFHQTVPPGPITKFRGVIEVLKRFPGVRDTREMHFSGV